MKLKYTIPTLFISILLSACMVTDLEPKEGITDATYWRSIQDLEYYTNGLYAINGSHGFGDTNSDNLLHQTYNKTLFDEVVIPKTADDGGWSWRTVRQCNYFLNRYHTVSAPEAKINKYVAEVKFFKAQHYFGKIKDFGDVPWYDNDLQTTDKEELYKGRDPRGLILKHIIEDLEYAIEWLPEKGKEDQDRLHKDAAKSLLARVCLHEGTFRKYNKYKDDFSAEELIRKAADLSLEIMNTGKYKIVRGSNEGCGQIPYEGYPLHYSNLFIQDDLWGNEEAILAIRYIRGVSRFGHFLGFLSSQMPQRGCSKDFIESFLCVDGKPIGVSELYKGDNTFEDEIANRDPRLYQIVDNDHKPFFIQDGQQIPSAPGFPVNIWDAVTGYRLVKFMPAKPEDQEAIQSMFDQFAFRYAEILLIYAEAKAELGECTQTVLDKTINLLRDRVDMAHLSVNPIADPNPINYGYNVSPLLYEIRRERRIELVGEIVRWDDIMRWNAVKLFENPKTMVGLRITPDMIALDGMLSMKQTIKIDGKNYLRIYIDKEINDPKRKWEPNDKRYLSPLPIQELSLNPNLKQNPGWE